MQVTTTLWIRGLTLQWRHNDHDGVANHQPHGCLLNRLFRRRSKKTSKLRVTGLCVGNSPGPVNSPHKRPVTRKMFPFDDVIMTFWNYRRTMCWCLNQMALILQTTLPNAFCWKKIFLFSFKFHWISSYSYNQQRFDVGLANGCIATCH